MASAWNLQLSQAKKFHQVSESTKIPWNKTRRGSHLLNPPKNEPQNIKMPNLAILLVLKDISANLVGGFNPFEKYARQFVSFPQIGVKIPKIFRTTS